jgi:hypothetical protein
MSLKNIKLPKHHAESLPLLCMLKVYFDQLHFQSTGKSRPTLPMEEDDIDGLEEDIATYKMFLDEVKKHEENEQLETKEELSR